MTPQTVDHGLDCSPVTANAPALYDFVKWTLSGSDYSTDNPLTVTSATGNMTLIAVFTFAGSGDLLATDKKWFLYE